MNKSKKGINERILRGIRDNSDSPVMTDFLLGLIREEIILPHGLRKDDYRKRLEEWTQKVEDKSNEN